MAQGVAYRQAARLTIIPVDIAQGIRQAVIELMISGRLRKEKHATRVHLSRFHQSKSFLSIMYLLLYLPTVDFLWIALTLSVLLMLDFIYNHPSHFLQIILLFIVIVVPCYIIYWKPSIRFFIIDSNAFDRWRRTSQNNAYYSMVVLLMTKLIIAEIFVLEAFYYLNVHKYHMFIDDIFLVVYVLLSLNALTAAPIALYASSTEYLNYWILWALIPLFPTLWLILYCYSKLFYILRYLYKHIKSILIIIFVMLILLAIIIGTSLLIIHLWNNTIVQYFVFIVFAIMAIVFIWGMIVGTFRYLHDWKQWRTWAAATRETMTYQRFWRTVNSYQTTQYRIKMIKAVREQQRLIATDKTESFLRKIAQEAEKKIQHKSSAKPSRVSRKVAKNVKRRKTLSWMDHTALDELYKLLENIRILNEDTSIALSNTNYSSE